MFANPLSGVQDNNYYKRLLNKTYYQVRIWIKKNIFSFISNSKRVCLSSLFILLPTHLTTLATYVFWCQSFTLTIDPTLFSCNLYFFNLYLLFDFPLPLSWNNLPLFWLTYCHVSVLLFHALPASSANKKERKQYSMNSWFERDVLKGWKIHVGQINKRWFIVI